MKKIIIIIMVIVTGLSACTSQNSNSNQSPEQSVNPEVKQTVLKMDTVQKGDTTTGISTKEIVVDYLNLKNALAKDNSKEAAVAGKAMINEFSKIEMKKLSEGQMKTYMDLADDIKENAEHIGSNSGKIDHQREHFVMLSKDIADLIKAFGNDGQVLYKDFCPMANDGKGATWISEIKEIKNPYMGSKMSDCGSIKETLK